MQVRIYKASRSTMQAGVAGTRYWILEFSPEKPRTPDPLMGWSTELDTRRQIRMRFETLDQALDFAREHGFDVDLESAQAPRVGQKSYAENFAFNRLIPWSH